MSDAHTGDVHEGVEAWLAHQGGRPSTSSDVEPPVPEDVAAVGPEADPESVARKILLDQLTGQARSRAELAQKLAKKGVPEAVGTRLLDRFEEVGLVDDAAFAQAWVSTRQSSKGLSRRALAQELRTKGIDDEVAREALDQIDPDDELESARVLVRRKLRSLQRADHATALRRLSALLGRKGYPPAMAFAVAREELAAADDDAPEESFPDPDVPPADYLP